MAPRFQKKQIGYRIEEEEEFGHMVVRATMEKVPAKVPKVQMVCFGEGVDDLEEIESLAKFLLEFVQAVRDSD